MSYFKRLLTRWLIDENTVREMVEAELKKKLPSGSDLLGITKAVEHL